MGKHQKDDFSYWAFQAQKQRLRHTQTAGPWRTEKHQNCDQKLPNVTSENCDHEKLRPKDSPRIILATFSSWKKRAPGWENTMAVKDGKASKLRPKTP